MTRNYYLLLCALFFNFQLIIAQNTWYVSETGTGTGTSWGQASNNLQNIINNALPGDQVWIK